MIENAWNAEWFLDANEASWRFSDQAMKPNDDDNYDADSFFPCRQCILSVHGVSDHLTAGALGGGPGYRDAHAANSLDPGNIGLLSSWVFL
ncbi:unnamed protein product [Phytophthora lilii]|uniref:Unnamed protein product n=1 Tax=Phytophthora lilii TaxID=2077276 RepID=A0A9W6TPG3_9STRA|nr:unnamed protein product [Phytophthora lilii]